jgi:hypothetical protein
MLMSSTSRKPDPRPVFFGASATLGLTTVHHVYGGVLYASPWRIHGAGVAMAIGVLSFALFSVYRRCPDARLGRSAGWLLALVVLFFPVLATGVFEGAYNHVLKNVLFLLGTRESVLLRMFPPPVYELPNDAGFEISGIAQVIPAAFAAIATFRFVQELRSSTKQNGPTTRLP